MRGGAVIGIGIALGVVMGVEACQIPSVLQARSKAVEVG
jgi:hypothetical protein